MRPLLVGFITGIAAVLVPGVMFVARVLTHATRTLEAANAKHLEAQRLFSNAQLLRSDEDRVAELAFMAWGYEQRFSASALPCARSRGSSAKRSARDVCRGCCGRSPASALR